MVEWPADLQALDFDEFVAFSERARVQWRTLPKHRLTALQAEARRRLADAEGRLAEVNRNLHSAQRILATHKITEGTLRQRIDRLDSGRRQR